MNRKIAFASFALSFALAASSEAALVKGKSKKPVTSAASEVQKSAATPETIDENNLDRFYRLRRVLLFPGIDDLNGVIATQMDQKLTELFSKNPRFELVVDQAVIHALSPDEASYAKIAQSESIHKEAARAANVDATILVRLHTSAGKTEVQLDWRDRNGVLLISDNNTLPSYSSLEAQQDLLEGIFQSSVQKIPFQGSVTGRKGNTITIDLGDSQITPGSEVDIGRIVSVQRHPLLKTIVHADMVKVGRAKVGTADRVLSFAEVQEETANESVNVDNKIMAIRAPERRKQTQNPPKAVPMYDSREDRHDSSWKKRRYSREEENETTEENETASPKTKVLKGDFDRAKARYGALSAAGAIGNINHTNTVNGTTTDVSGTGIGAALGGELWVTRNWLGALDYHFQSASLSGTQAGGTISAGSSSWNRLDVYGAYRFFPSGRLEATSVTLGLGYEIKNINIPENTSLNTEAKKYTGLLLRADADIYMNPSNRLGAGLSLVPFGSAPGLQGINSLGFRLSWSFLLDSTLWARLGFDYDAASGSTPSGSTTRSDKRYALEPGIVYYF